MDARFTNAFQLHHPVGAEGAAEQNPAVASGRPCLRKPKTKKSTTSRPLTPSRRWREDHHRFPIARRPSIKFLCRNCHSNESARKNLAATTTGLQLIATPTKHVIRSAPKWVGMSSPAVGSGRPWVHKPKTKKSTPEGPPKTSLRQASAVRETSSTHQERQPVAAKGVAEHSRWLGLGFGCPVCGRRLPLRRSHFLRSINPRRSCGRPCP